MTTVLRDGDLRLRHEPKPFGLLEDRYTLYQVKDDGITRGSITVDEKGLLRLLKLVMAQVEVNRLTKKVEALRAPTAAEAPEQTSQTTEGTEG